MAVYIVQGTITKRLKIGYTEDFEKRFPQLQRGCSEELEVVEVYPYGRDVEKWYHRRFKKQRAIGEWFNLEGPVYEMYARIKNSQNRRSIGL